MKHIHKDFFVSPIGLILIEATETMLVGISLAKEMPSVAPNAITQKAKEWLAAYFAKNLLPLPPLSAAPTKFSQLVREATLQIPFGKCKSYGEVAKAIGRPKAYRAVAQALKYNPFMIMVPCHRVIGKSGLGGYNGGIEIKRKLLEFEACELINF